MNILLFCLAAALVIVIPGPNVLVIVATALTHGRQRGLQTVLGTSTAMLVQLTVVALATTGFVSLLSEGFRVLKWLGVAYLVWLGLRLLLNSFRRHHHQQTVPISALGSFQQGFWVSLTNPKTLLFFSAFLPQFTVTGQAYLPQIALLSALFWVLAVALDTVYALLAGSASGLLISPRIATWASRLSGTVYLGAAAMLAGSRQT